MLKLLMSMIVMVISPWVITKEHIVAHADILGDTFANFEHSSSFFTSIFSTLHGFMKTVGKTIDAAIEKECVYQCPNGRKPKPNLYHVPQGNGCGVAGLQIPKYVPMSQVEKCCNEHDVCYGTCNKKQQACDDTFKECLYEICSFLKGYYVTEDFVKGCKLVAKTMYTAVTAMGCKYYLDAQEEACLCDKNSYDEF